VVVANARTSGLQILHRLGFARLPGGKHPDRAESLSSS
jgi:hypothetical protein